MIQDITHKNPPTTNRACVFNARYLQGKKVMLYINLNEELARIMAVKLMYFHLTNLQ